MKINSFTFKILMTVFAQIVFLNSAWSEVKSETKKSNIFGLCMTNMAPTTTFAFATDDEHVELNVIHHNGLKYAPFWFSPVVPADLTVLQEKANLIEKLDKIIIVKWKKDKCEFHDKNIVHCVGSTEPLEINGIKIEPWAVYSSTNVEKSFAGVFEYTEVAFRFYVNGEAHNMVMKYQQNECDLSNERKKSQ